MVTCWNIGYNYSYLFSFNTRKVHTYTYVRTQLICIRKASDTAGLLSSSHSISWLNWFFKKYMYGVSEVFIAPFSICVLKRRTQCSIIKFEKKCKFWGYKKVWSRYNCETFKLCKKKSLLIPHCTFIPIDRALFWLTIPSIPKEGIAFFGTPDFSSGQPSFCQYINHNISNHRM